MCHDDAHEGAILALGAVALAACGGGVGDDLAEAFCSDLRNGMNMMSLHGQIDRDDPPAAALIWASDECPDQLRDNEGFRTYLTNWGLDPDDA